MARHKDSQWDPQAAGAYTWANVPIYILQDIRDELKELNVTMRILRCQNFIGIPTVLRRIARNTANKKRKRALMP